MEQTIIFGRAALDEHAKNVMLHIAQTIDNIGEFIATQRTPIERIGSSMRWRAIQVLRALGKLLGARRG